MSPAEIDAARRLADEARARADAATDPPWVAAGQYDEGVVVAECAPCDVVRTPRRWGLDGNECEWNAIFIAAARDDVPALADALAAALDALAAAEAERDAARGVAQLAVEERDAMHMRAERAEATIAEAWATMPPERVRLLGGMGVTLAEVVTDAREWREHEGARADAAEAERDALRKQLSRAQDELDAYRDAHRGRATP